MYHNGPTRRSAPTASRCQLYELVNKLTSKQVDEKPSTTIRRMVFLLSPFSFLLSKRVALYSALETNLFFRKVVFYSKWELLRAKLGVKFMAYKVGKTTSKIVPPMFEEI